MVAIIPTENLFIAGITGSGKSWLARHLFNHCQTPLAIFVSIRRENVKGWQTEQVRLKDLFKHKRVVWLANPRTFREDLEQLVQRLFLVGKQFNTEGNRKNPWCTIFIDEAFMAESPIGGGPLTNLSAQNLGFGCPAVFASQRPANTSSTCFKMCEQIILFNVSQAELDYVQKNIGSLSPEDYAWIQQKYHFLYYRHGIWTRCVPI